MAQLAVNKGVKVSQDGTVYSEFLTQPAVWQGVLVRRQTAVSG